MPRPPIWLNAETELIAHSLVWFEPPEQALADPVRFMAYAMARATHEQMRTILRHVTEAEFLESLDNAPPGIIDARSWAYWNSKLGRYPRRQCPRAVLGDRPTAYHTP